MNQISRHKHPSFINLVGRRFSRLTVISYAGSYKNRGACWKCLCDCGSELVVWRQNLLTNHTRSCGCLQKETVSKIRRKPDGQASFNYLLKQYRKDARRRGYIFLLSNDEFKELTSSKCFYCGIEPHKVMKSRFNSGDYIYNGIDRLNNTLGYIRENCVPCCKVCNRAKDVMSYSDFVHWIRKVNNYLEVDV